MQKIFITILFSISLIAFSGVLVDKLKWNDIFSIWILAATAYVIAKQAWATQELARGKPTVDVSIIFDKNYNSTFFQFINISKIPALIWINVKPKINDSTADGDEFLKKYLNGNDYLIGKKEIDLNITDPSLSPSSGFGKDLFENLILESRRGKKVELILAIDVAPAHDKSARSFFQTKYYTFYPDDNEWKRMPFWGISERSYF